MKKHLFYIVMPFLFIAKSYGQEFNTTINKDSLFQTLIKDFPEEEKANLSQTYYEENEESKWVLLFMLSMPVSSKKEMISNIDSNFEKINLLKTEYAKLIPKNYSVYIEFNPANILLMKEETIDLRIDNGANKESDLKYDWNLEYNSKKLIQMIKPLHWTMETLEKIKKMLVDAHCISVENGEITTIGFARSGMGKYYFKLFNTDLSEEQIKQYNDGCNFIYYKKNIVLEYGGGAIGPQCFPDDE